MRILGTATLTVLLVVTGCMLVFLWLFGPQRTSLDSVSVAVVFAGALIGRCILARPVTDRST